MRINIFASHLSFFCLHKRKKQRKVPHERQLQFFLSLKNLPYILPEKIAVRTVRGRPRTASNIVLGVEVVV